MLPVSAQQIQSSCYQSLARCGFIRHAPFGLDWPINQDFHCWVRVNVRQRARHFQIEPLVGIHAPLLEQFWTGLKVGPYRAAYRREIPTTSTSLLAIAGNRQPLVLDGDRKDGEAMEQLIALYRETGLGFARSTASYEAIEPVLRRSVRALGGNPERLATCLY